MKNSRVVVVGNGMVGHHFVDQMIASEIGAHITVLGAETRPAYDRVHLSEVFSGKEPKDLALTTREFYKDNGVDAIFGDAVTDIDRKNKIVITESGRRFDYDKLVLATGSYPFVPPIKGSESKECLTYRTIDDLGEIKSHAQTSKIGVVVGGGLLGLECANALQNLGLETHVVEFAPGLMGVQLDDGGSKMLRRKIEALGVQVHTQKATTLIDNKGDNTKLRMNFADDTHLDTDMIVFSAGIRPYDQLARKTGLEVGERGGIVVDYHCRTSDSNIFAIGECALYGNMIYGLVAPGYRMAEVAVQQFSDDDEKPSFTGSDMSTKLKLLGVDVGSIGDAHGKTPGSIAYVYSNENSEIYKRIIVSEDGNTLLGAVLVGDCSDYDTLLQYYLNGIELPENPEGMILPNVEGGGPALGASALPMEATICSCLNVSKGDIINALDSGCCSVGDVKGETKAASGCGGCAALLKDVVDTELEARGVTVDKSICEHFPHTREELYHLIRVGSIKSFGELVEKHGTGLGCDICKPAVANMLAASWNDYILEEQHTGLQDTNDTFLANMQKDGTYSVVPRVPGGEITPEQLIAIGQVGQKYKLYTKITGGQRIDLFGAKLNDLPTIWGELIAAGLETGHAYGKSLRTVKSCVGSTWCRYGVQDSVGQAIDIENRYKGLRTPHKLKMAVSGCTRECAEAQSKDVGIIATENGWNLYLCGNGGMKPRHADLFATDISTETLVKYIDRFLMFYIKTADRLQRTSVWMDNLEGGIEYLREVIIEDSLGIAAELEAQMQSVVDTYQCEWKTTVEDETKLRRFRQFVNSDKEDSNVVFVEERGQVRPASEDEKSKLIAKSA
ncbi:MULTISPECIES: nitrite reductase large subunit NirB [unclassified Oleiphilus]|uniref:nitrite reductase large subunit NirB n=3 Tax=Oleiphilus TaxID=141450 RepID=UPI0007C27AC3|nr:MULTISPECIES: nitrite reductase large subunit NirB [unclassified Oleiphilus]KZZ34659.1 nitrite reductase large subunit [Oleiphilus sp. HI0117]KZZ36394.1 nitrite reductase large subunit [Oleiphilus sp. HI0086]KZZ57166.1 nitrite reductase large subunit [Oleiphilus sp. HI0123]